MPAQRRMMLTKLNSRYVLSFTGSRDQLQVEFDIPGEDTPELDVKVLRAVRKYIGTFIKDVRGLN